MTILFGGTGQALGLRGQPTNTFALQGGNTRIIPAGAWLVTTGLYSVVQELDGVSGYWKQIGSGLSGAAQTLLINSDGTNFRIANQSGCVVGGIVTNGGAGYTVAPSVTASNGNAAITAILGGAVSASVTIGNGGSNYVYPPLVFFSAPNAGAGGGPYGIQATGVATISGGAVTAITVTDQGAGYTIAPTITLQNDPRDTTGIGATATCALTGSGTVTGLVVTDFGNAYTSTALPTLSFSGTSTSGAAATAIMNWSIASYSVTSTGAGYASPLLITTVDNGFTTTAGSTTNPTITTNLVRTRQARIKGIVSGGAVSATGQVIYDAGVFSGVPTLVPIGFSSGSVANLAPTMGPQTDVNFIYPV